MYDELKGNDIILRKARYDDYKTMLKNIWSNPEIYENMLFAPTFTTEEAIARIQRTIEFQKHSYTYFVADRKTNEAIGFAGIKDNGNGHFEECGICIAGKCQGKGYGKETVYLLLDLAFNQLNAMDFEYGYFQDNIRSKMVADHFHFRHIRTVEMIRPWDKKNKVIDIALLTKEEFENI